MKLKIKLNEKKLQSLGVGLVVLFGSKITGAEHPGSDFDIGIIFKDEKFRKAKPVEAYGRLFEEFSRGYGTDKIDIVYLQEAPLSLQYKAIRDGIVLYHISPTFYADYKEYVLKNYFDFKFFEDIFQKAIFNAR